MNMNPMDTQSRASLHPSVPSDGWQDYYTYVDSQHGHHHGYHVSGTVKVLARVESPALNNARHVLAYLPPSYYHSDRRYAVIYMQDGQNLFDNATSYAGEWGVDETMERLGYQEGLEAIVVGIPNMGTQRVNEYSPFHDAHLGGGLGAAYIDYLADTVKPLIDRDFRTLPGRRTTGIMGSSLGGLISLFGFFHRPQTFGYVGVMSPSLWFAHGAIFDYVSQAAYHPGKIYLDVGTRELGESHSPDSGHRAARSRAYYASVRRMKGVLIRKGYRPLRDLLHVEEKWAGHSESSWARRLPLAIRFFLTEAYRASSG